MNLAGELLDFMQESVKSDYGVSQKGQLRDVKAGKGLAGYCFHNMQIALVLN